LAYDVVERKPGLAATRRMDGAPEQDRRRGDEGRQGSGEHAVVGCQHRQPWRHARDRRGTHRVNEQGQDATTLTADGTVLLLDAPADLEVFVIHAM